MKIKLKLVQQLFLIVNCSMTISKACFPFAADFEEIPRFLSKFYRAKILNISSSTIRTLSCKVHYYFIKSFSI